MLWLGGVIALKNTWGLTLVDLLWSHEIIMCMIRSRAITGRPILSIGTAGGITSATNVEATKTPPGRRTLLISATYEKITNIIRTFTNRYKVGGEPKLDKEHCDGWITELQCRSVIEDCSVPERKNSSPLKLFRKAIPWSLFYQASWTCNKYSLHWWMFDVG